MINGMPALHVNSDVISDYLSSPKRFIETFLIIQDKETGTEMPFIFNDVQNALYAKMMREHFRKTYDYKGDFIGYRFCGMRYVLCKSRQLGGSTYICGIFGWDTFFFRGVETLIYTQDAPTSKIMLRKWNKFLDNLPGLIDIPTDLDSTTLITFPDTDGLVEALSPGSTEQTQEKQGRSRTIRNLLCSEFPNWPNPFGTLDGLLESVMLNGNVVVEGSPDFSGSDFHGLYELGKTSDKFEEKIGSGQAFSKKAEQDQPEKKIIRNFSQAWTSIFIPWYHVWKNRIHLTRDERIYISETLTQDELQLIKKHHLDMEQIAFRRSKIAGKRGDMQAFWKEYPEDDQTAFQGHLGLYFPLAVRKTTCEPRWARRGAIHGIGADVALGITGDGDLSSIYVIDYTVMEQIFGWVGHVAPDKLAGLIYLTWLCYPGLVGIESNSYGQSTLKEALEFDWMEPEPGFLYTNNANHGGFYQSDQTKFQGFQDMKNALVDHHMGGPGLKISCPHLVKEMGWIQRNKRGWIGAPDERKGKRTKSTSKMKKTDDAAVGCMLAYQMTKNLDLVHKQMIHRFGRDYLFIPDKPLPELFELYINGELEVKEVEE